MKAINEVGSSSGSEPVHAVVRSSSVGSNETPANNHSPLAEILINNKAIEASTISSMSNGISIFTIQGSKTELEKQLAAEKPGISILYRTKENVDRIVVEMDGQLAKSMTTKQAVITFQTAEAKYVLPAEQLNLEALAGQLGQSVALQDIEQDGLQFKDLNNNGKLDPYEDCVQVRENGQRTLSPS